MRVKICLNRFLKRCPNCTEDYDQCHHPNNLDCPYYREVVIELMEIKEEKKGYKNRRTFKFRTNNK